MRALKMLAIAPLAALMALPGAAVAGRRTPHRHSEAHFRITYAGSGTQDTIYHSTPPNQGGDPDTNDAHDTGRQRWMLRSASRFAVPTCGARRRPRRPDPCAAMTGSALPKGASTVTGEVWHRHVDGLYADPDQNRSISCTMTASTPAAAHLGATVGVRYLRRSNSFAISLSNPVTESLLALPSACPGQGDSIDGLFDNYFTPGFSFAAGTGPDAWFVSRRTTVPAARFHRGHTVRVRIKQAPQAVPAQDCAVEHRSYERCSTRGSWSGLLTFTPVR
jgi:hypothetical protein